MKTEQCWAIKWVLEQLKKAQGKGKAIQKSSGEMEEKEKVGTRIRLGLKPWGELKIDLNPPDLQYSMELPKIEKPKFGIGKVGIPYLIG